MQTALHIKHVRAWESFDYRCVYYKDFDFKLFENIDCKFKTTKGCKSYNDIIIMADTETSKPHDYPQCLHNYVVAWSIAFRAYDKNLVTLYGHNPLEFVDMLKSLRENLPGFDIYIHFHNLAYDWTFLRKFLIQEFGKPVSQLNTKSMYPLYIQFSNGIRLKDTLALAQRSLDKWSKDMGVTSKATGLWMYDKVRNQCDPFNADEVTYIEHDVVSGVECMDATLKALKKNISSVPITATGIARGESRKAGGKEAHDYFVRLAPSEYWMQEIYQHLFHGGYTHGNRYYLGEVHPALCEDIASSYPFCVHMMDAPTEQFFDVPTKDFNWQYVKDNPGYAFIFLVKVFDLDLKDRGCPMPMLSHSKCEASLNAILDNGRVLQAKYAEFWSNEIDFELFMKQYKFSDMQYVKPMCASKGPLPKWFRDFIYERFTAKTMLKGVDQVKYQIEKGMLNAAAYGMCAQQPCKPLIEENYDTGEYAPNEDINYEEMYKKYLKNPKSFLPFIWAVYITSYAQKNLFELGECVDYEHGGIWLYSDTDSVYATKFDEEKLKAYNEKRINIMKERGYDPVFFNGRYYNFGVAEFDGEYSEFKMWHSKCYSCRDKETGKLKITVAGVPKKGVDTLEDDIANFMPGLIFDGKTSGKLQHTHFYVDEIYTDAYGNIIGDSIDLTPCDYLLRSVNEVDFDEIEEDEIGLNVYGGDDEKYY